MKSPNLIYTYSQRDNQRCAIREYELNVYLPSKYTEKPKYLFSFATKLFGITCQANTDQAEFPGKGLKSAYALRFDDFEFGNSEALKIAAKLASNVSKDGGMSEVVRRLRKLGAKRFALANINEDNDRQNREFVPRRFARKTAPAYWRAINAGLEIAA